jgi:hypothetical protein
VKDRSAIATSGYGLSKEISSVALRRASPSTKYQFVDADEAHGWLETPSGVATSWLTLAIPP